MNRPVPMSQQDLAALLQDMLDRVKVGDSLEGSIEYALPYIGDPEDTYAMVRAVYRVGNLQGQGGMRMVGEVTSEPDPLRAELDRLREQRGGLLRLIRDLLDSDDCWFDHHGGCQAHGYLSLGPGEQCPHAEAKALLDAEGVAR